MILFYKLKIKLITNKTLQIKKAKIIIRIEIK